MIIKKAKRRNSEFPQTFLSFPGDSFSESEESESELPELLSSLSLDEDVDDVEPFLELNKTNVFLYIVEKKREKKENYF